MSISFSGLTPLRKSIWSRFGHLLARASLRTRMMMLITVAALPALLVLAFTQYTVHVREMAEHGEVGFWMDAFALTGSLLILGGGLMSLGFGVAVGEHFLRRPTEALLTAAEQWQSGQFDARIDVGASAGNEFGRIALTFNRMAEALGRQHEELRALNNDLEARVEARTSELSESNQRLVAEMAERERAEATLRQSQKLQAVGQLAGGIAHDFNNLLTTILGALDMLRGRMAGGQDPLLRMIDNALQAAERGTRLTSQLMSFSRRQRLAPVPTNMNETLVALIELLNSTLGREIAIHTEFADGLWPAMVDPSQVEAAILNLAVNARDAMPQGGVLTFTTSNITVDAGRGMAAGDYVAVRVSDDGLGMADDIVNLAFEPFFTTKEPGQGSGLGLSQVHGLAVQSGGDVRIQSAPGKGTTVTLLLPRAVAAASPAAISPESRASGGCRARILVVDDDPNVREMTCDMLTDRGFSVVSADCSEAALAILHADPAFDMLLTDFVMPGLNGLGLVQAARDLIPGLRCLMMTSHAELMVGNSIAPEQLLQKPFTLAQLDERVGRLLGRPRLTVIKGGIAAAF